MKQFVVISMPHFFYGEAKGVIALFKAGMKSFHLRKPECPENEIKQFLHQIPEEFYDRIVLHDSLNLASTIQLKGIHLNRRNPSIPNGFNGCISRSCHSLQEIKESAGFDYVFLSPIFDSISKKNYKSNFSIATLQAAQRQNIITDRVIALGGMDEESIPRIRCCGFGGVAVLGALWMDFAQTLQTQLLIKRFNLLQTCIQQ